MLGAGCPGGLRQHSAGRVPTAETDGREPGCGETGRGRPCRVWRRGVRLGPPSARGRRGLWGQGSRPANWTPFCKSAPHQQGALPPKSAPCCLPPVLCTHCAICPRPPAVYSAPLEQLGRQLEPVGKQRRQQWEEQATGRVHTGTVWGPALTLQLCGNGSPGQAHRSEVSLLTRHLGGNLKVSVRPSTMGQHGAPPLSGRGTGPGRLPGGRREGT